MSDLANFLWFWMFVALIVLFPESLIAQNTTLHPAWKAGNEVRLQIHRDIEDASLPGGANSITDLVLLRVLDVGPSGSRIEWTKLPGRNAQYGENRGLGIRLEAELDERGHCRSIRNQPKATLADSVGFALEEVEPYLGAISLAQQRMPPLKDVVGRAINELALYLGFEGLELTGTPYQYEQPYQRPTAFESHPLRGTLVGSVSKAGPFQVELGVTVRYNQSALRGAVEEMLRRPPFSSRPGRVADLSLLTLVENVEMKGKVERGIPDELSWTRKLSDADRWAVTEQVKFEITGVDYSQP